MNLQYKIIGMAKPNSLTEDGLYGDILFYEELENPVWHNTELIMDGIQVIRVLCVYYDEPKQNIKETEI